MVSNILVALQRADPAHATGYAANAALCSTRLLELNAELLAGLAALTNRTLVTAHDAFPYFARRYGLRIVGVLEKTPDVAPSPRHLANLRKIIEQEQVKAIFIEPAHPAKLTRQFAADLGIRVATLDTLETGEFTLTAYEDGMRRNLRALQDALK